MYLSKIPEECGTLITQHLTPKFLRGFSTTQNEDIKKECLDRMSDILKRFGHLLTQRVLYIYIYNDYILNITYIYNIIYTCD